MSLWAVMSGAKHRGSHTILFLQAFENWSIFSTSREENCNETLECCAAWEGESRRRRKRGGRCWWGEGGEGGAVKGTRRSFRALQRALDVTPPSQTPRTPRSSRRDHGARETRNF